MKLHDLHPAPGSRKPARRVGRGHGSGRGKTAGRGTKGQKSRAGGNLPAWFEGGQTPLHVRTPKLHGFRNRGRVAYVPINLSRLASVEKGTLVTPDVLAHDGLIADVASPVKVLGVGDAPAGITVHAHAFSRSAVDKLTAAGSTVQRLGWPGNEPLDEVFAERRVKRARKGKGKGKAKAAATTDDNADDTADEAAAAAGDEPAAGDSGADAPEQTAAVAADAGEPGESESEA
jgi:large subunit ribosomal protein L15